MTAHASLIADSKDESFLSKLDKHPIKIYVSDVKEVVDACNRVQKAKAKKSILGDLLISSKPLTQLRHFLKKLQPKADEKTSLLTPNKQDTTTPLDDKQLFELAEIIIKLTFHEDDEILRACLAPLKEKFKASRLHALYRLAKYAYDGARLDFKNFKLVCEADPVFADSFAIFILCQTNPDIPVTIAQQDDYAKVSIWSDKIWGDPFYPQTFRNWRHANLKDFILYAIRCPLKDTQAVADASALLTKHNIFTAENREILLGYPACAANIAYALVWLLERKIYTPANIQQIFEHPEICGHLKLVGNVVVEKRKVLEQDLVLNQIIFNETMKRATALFISKTVWQFFPQNPAEQKTPMLDQKQTAANAAEVIPAEIASFLMP